MKNDNSPFKDNPNPLYGIGEDPTTEKSWFLLGSYNGKALIGNTTKDEKADLVIPVIGFDLGVGIGIKTDVSLNISKAVRYLNK